MVDWKSLAAKAAWTVCFVMGIVAMLVGLGLAWRPAAWLFGGAVLALIGFGGYREQYLVDRRGRRS